MNNENLFDFLSPQRQLEQHTANSVNRSTNTVPETVKHGVIHTKSPNSTIHHTVIAACPYPKKELAQIGKYYMIAYVSIPLTWLDLINDEMASRWDISFIGPSGVIQKLVPALADLEMILGDRIYIGFDWLWIGPNLPIQPAPEKLISRLQEFVNEMRQHYEPEFFP